MTRSASSPRAGSMMIGTFESRRSSRQTSTPEPSGSITSSRTRSGSNRRACSSASSTVPATRVSKPSRSRAAVKGSVIESSSSTSRIVRRPPAIPGTLPGPCGKKSAPTDAGAVLPGGVPRGRLVIASVAAAAAAGIVRAAGAGAGRAGTRVVVGAAMVVLHRRRDAAAIVVRLGLAPADVLARLVVTTAELVIAASSILAGLVLASAGFGGTILPPILAPRVVVPGRRCRERLRRDCGFVVAARAEACERARRGDPRQQQHRSDDGYQLLHVSLTPSWSLFVSPTGSPRAP